MSSTILKRKKAFQGKAMFLLVLPLTLSLCIIGTRPARAFLLESINIDLIFQIISQVISENFGIERWLDVLLDPCSDRFPWDEKPFCGPGTGNGVDVGEIFEESKGDLGIPNPNETRQKTEEAVNSAVGAGSQPDVFEVNPTVYSVYAANQVDRLNTQASIETVLGKEGQEQIKKQLDLTKETVEGIATDTDDAQSLDVTQDVMKKQTQVLNGQSIILSAIPTNLQHLRVDNQYIKLNLGNISRTMDEIARSKRVEASSDAMYLFELYSATSLR